MAKRERGAAQDQPIAIVQLVGQGHDDTAALTIGECRPVTWTQAMEDGDVDLAERAFRRADLMRDA